MIRSFHMKEGWRRARRVFGPPWQMRSLRESSLNRIIHHINSPDSTFAVISASKGYYTAEENKARSYQLMQDVKVLQAAGVGVNGKRIGFIPLMGGYRSRETGQYEYEFSILINNIDQQTAQQLAQSYDQEAILWKDPDQFVLLNVNTGEVWETFAQRDFRGVLSFSESDFYDGFSSLARANSNQRVKFSFVKAQPPGPIPGAG